MVNGTNETARKTGWIVTTQQPFGSANRSTGRPSMLVRIAC
ncbi:MAG: hypothetical protein ACJAUS_001645 [Qipengyuania sp.]|jgi:hypothetical protein